MEAEGERGPVINVDNVEKASLWNWLLYMIRSKFMGKLVPRKNRVPSYDASSPA